MSAIRAALALLGLACAALLVWTLGPLVPHLGSVPARLAAIAAIFMSAGALFAWRTLRNSRRNAALLEALGTGASDEVAELANRFAAAIATLHRTRLGDRRTLGARVGGRRLLHELPWYVIIGAPGSGKTTALERSGLEFPLAEKLGRGAVRGVGGTRNCDWWFTSEAVLIDTAGRYTTQDSDERVDRAAWAGFLRLLAKYRPERPINGVLLTVSVADLLTANPAERERHATRLRARIDELHETLGMRVPIYVLVTKVDLLPGFVEHFGDLGEAERREVWGVTFAHADGSFASLGRELGALGKRLNERMLVALGRTAERDRRPAIYRFPQHWQWLRELLEPFLARTLEDRVGAPRLAVRGVYFTSGTQEGTPIDRALGGLARALGLADRLVPPRRAGGKSFFVTRLFTDVIFPEAELAGTNLAWIARRRRLQWAAIGAAALVVVGLVAVWWRAEAVIRDELAALAPELDRLEQRVKDARSLARTELAGLTPVLDSLQSLAQPAASADFRFGLDQSERIATAADDAYRRTLRSAFLPRIAAQLEERIKTAPERDTERVYEALKAYLMLFGGKNFARAPLESYLLAEWNRTLAPAVPESVRASLKRHLEALLGAGEVGAPAQADQQLIERARARVVKIPLAQRVYERLRQSESSADEVAVSVAGADAGATIVRASGHALERGIPRFFTRTGYRQLFGDRIAAVAQQLSGEAPWVLGMAAPGESDDRLIAEVAERYFADYRGAWQAYLADLRLARIDTLAQTAEAARVLARPDSPLAAVLAAAARETALADLSTSRPFAQAGDAVDRHFEPLRRAVAGQPSPLADAAALVGRLHTHLVASEDAAKRRSAAPQSAIVAELGSAAATLPDPARGMFTQLAGASGVQLVALQRESARGVLAAEVVAPCMKLVAGRYPLARASQDDAQLADFALVLGPGGALDGFFQKHLAAQVDTAAAQWRYRSGESSEALRAFQRARAIRDAFFAANAKGVSIALQLRLIDMDASLQSFGLDLDGQTVTFSAGARGPQTVQWPAGKGQVRLQVTPPTASGAAGYVFEGPWGLFRLLDRARVDPGASASRMQVVFDVEGRRARVEFVAPRGVLPFRLPELEAFQCPKEL